VLNILKGQIFQINIVFVYVCVCVCRLQIVNHGAVDLKYSWHVQMDPRDGGVNQDQRGITAQSC